MTRTERTWHWWLWLIIALVLAVLFVIALLNKPAATIRTSPRAAQEGQP